jgi:hypothetical protein
MSALKAGLFIAFGFVLTWVGLVLLMPVDDSDVDRWNRSGVTVITDEATGCQYLSRSSGIIARANADGTHRGCRK